MDILSTLEDLINKNAMNDSKTGRDHQKGESDASRASLELLYIWINQDETEFIHGQGFNLSPKYRFEMKPNGDEEFELFCVEKTDYPNVWKTGNLTNLTAIVGENGSGKTALLRHLLNVTFLQFDEEEAYTGDYAYALNMSAMVLIYRYGDLVLIFNDICDNFINHTDYPVINVSDSIFYRIQKLFSQQTRIYISNTRSSPDSSFSRLWNTKPVFFSQEDNIDRARSFFAKTGGFRMEVEWPERFVSLQKHLISKRGYDAFDNFAAVSYYFHLHSKIHPGNSLFAGNREIIVDLENPENLFSYLSEIKYSVTTDPYGGIRHTPIDNTEIYSILLGRYHEHKNSLYGNDDPGIRLLLYLVFELSCLTFQPFPDSLFLEDDPYGYIDQWLTDSKDEYGFQEKVISYYKSALDEIREFRRVMNECAPGGTNLWGRCEFSLEHNRDAYFGLCGFIDSLMKKPHPFILKYLRIDMPPLSSGEQALQNIFTWLRMPPHFEELFGEVSVQIQDNILLLLDEVDLYMHPEWQRKFLKYLSDELALEYSDKNIQIIITTHSPLVLSDIPAGNIIYLEKNNEKCTIAQGPEQKESFGANIYSLLKDSFFLKRSLGEFAHSKITEVIGDLDRLKKNPGDTELRKTCEQHKHLIDIIGEPVIRRKLQLLYEDIFGKDPDADAERTLDSVQQLLKSDNPKYRELLKAMLSEVQSE